MNEIKHFHTFDVNYEWLRKFHVRMYWMRRLGQWWCWARQVMIEMKTSSWNVKVKLPKQLHA